MGNGNQPKITPATLRRAIAKGEFFYFYQPIVSLETGEICGAEALLRWKHADGTITLPDAFIPFAESTENILDLTLETLPYLMADLKQIHAIAPSSSIHFNVSSVVLKTNDLAGLFSENLASSGIAPGTFHVEIVESLFMPPVPKAEETIETLVSKGIPVVLDDFSAGYTTLKILSRLPLTAIKLDLNIVQQAAISKTDFRVLRHLVSMGHQLDLKIIAEGIETEEMYDLILSTGATSAQGYYFSHPLPLSDFLTMLQNSPTWSNYPFGLEYLAQIDLVDFRRDVIRAALTIHKYAQGGIRQHAFAMLPELDYRKNRLGRWISGIGKKWEGTPGFERLLQAHRKMHETAQDLIQAALHDEHSEIIFQFIGTLSNLSNQIAGFLEELELNGLVKHYKSPTSYD